MTPETKAERTPEEIAFDIADSFWRTNNCQHSRIIMVQFKNEIAAAIKEARKFKVPAQGNYDRDNQFLKGFNRGRTMLIETLRAMNPDKEFVEV